MKSNLESNLPIYNTIGDINHKDFVDGLISELYKIELVQTSFSLFLNLVTNHFFMKFFGIMSLYVKKYF